MRKAASVRPPKLLSSIPREVMSLKRLPSGPLILPSRRLLVLEVEVKYF